MSSLPSESPKLSKWPFLAFDAILLCTAALIAWQSDIPLSGASLLAVVGCVALAAIVCVIPFLTDYARSQEQALDERQQALEGLSKSVAASAEQLGVAVQGVAVMKDELRVLGEQLQKSLKHAEQLPQKLNERIAELQQHIAVVRDEEIEELEKEVSALRSSEAERLEGASDRIFKAIGELTRAEGLIAQVQEQARSQITLVAREAGQAAAQISKAAQEAAEQASLRIDGQLSNAKSSIADTFNAGKAELDEDLERRHQELHTLLHSLSAEFGAKLTGICGHVEEMLGQARQLAEEARRLSVPAPVLIPVPVSQPAAQVETPAVQGAPTVSPESPSTPPEAAEEPTAVQTPVVEVSPAPEPQPEPQPEAAARMVDESGVSSEPAPAEVPAADVPAPAAPVSEAPMDARPVVSEPAGVPASSEPQRQPLSRKARRQGAESSSMDLFSSDYNFEEAMVSHERSPVSSALSSDGATRLVVTSYIGIGNKLFLRGEGPGLSWEAGQPLEFVSIGKWRWQSSELSSTVKVRLYKNDRTECPGLGDIVLEPGHQTEVTAKF